MNRLVLFLCQGQQKRLPNLDRPKQLLPCAGMPLIERTISYLRKRLPNDTFRIVAKPHEGFVEVAERWNAELVTQKEPGLCINVGVEYTQRWWPHYDRVHLFLGDVVFSAKALDDTLDDDQEVSFTCTPDISTSLGEMFALSVSPDSTDGRFLSNQLDSGYCRHLHESSYQCGHLRRLLWLFRRPEQVIEYRRQCLPIPHTVIVNDYTDDIDYPEDLVRLDAAPPL